MSTSTIAPVLPEGAGYGVVVGIGVSIVLAMKMSHNTVDAEEVELTSISFSLPLLWQEYPIFR